MHALIIDDSRAMRRILRQIIESLGFDVIEAENGQVGVEQLEATEELDLVLVDWNMPVMNGFEFVEHVRADDSYKNLKLVMVTTETDPYMMAKALMAGVDEFVMKPFTKDILLGKLQFIGVCLPATSS